MDLNNQIKQMNIWHLNEKVNRFRLISKDKEIMISYNNKIVIYNIETEDKMLIYKEKLELSSLSHQNQITAISISSDDNTCLTVSKEQIKLWNIENMMNY